MAIRRDEKNMHGLPVVGVSLWKQINFPSDKQQLKPLFKTTCYLVTVITIRIFYKTEMFHQIDG